MPTLTIIDTFGEKISGRVYQGLTICDAIKYVGNASQMNCGGNARCASCKIKVLEGFESLSPLNDEEINRLTQEDINSHYRLACQAILKGDIVIKNHLN